MKTIKKCFAILTMGIAMSASLVAPASHAMLAGGVGLWCVSESTMYGLQNVLLATTATTYANKFIFHLDESSSPIITGFVKTIAGIALITILLDDSGNQKVVFQPVNEDLAKQKGLSAQEARAYNNELEVLQQVFDQVNTEVAAASEQDRVSVAEAGWQKYRGLLSNEALSGLGKLTMASN